MLTRMKTKWWLSFLFLLVFAAPSSVPPAVQRGMATISKDALRGHDRFIASDLTEGRGPGTRGDDIAMGYIAAQFESYGLKPAGDGGSFIQKVPLIGVTMDPEHTSVSFTKEGAPALGPLKYLDDCVATDQ